MQLRKDASAGLIEGESGDGESISRNIQAIERSIFLRLTMRVIECPVWDMRAIIDGKMLLNLKPAKDNMQIGGVPAIAICSVAIFGGSKPSVEQKDIARLDSLCLKMLFGSASLAKHRFPIGSAGNTARVEIGIEMRHRKRRDSAAGQIMNDRPKRMRTRADIAITRRALRR